MTRDLPAIIDLKTMEKNLEDALEEMGSLNGFENWLRSQSVVESVRLADFVIKTFPPQREILVTFRTEDGTRVTKVIDVEVLPDQTCHLVRLHDP